MLKAMQERYDVELKKLQEQVVSYNDYRRYGTLFDRTVPMDQKNLKKQKTARKASEGTPAKESAAAKRKQRKMQQKETQGAN